jgi:hypothetical protein
MKSERIKGKKVVRRTKRKNGQGSVGTEGTASFSLPRERRPDGRKLRASENVVLPRELLLETGSLPASYDTTRVVLLPVEPYLVTVYWELSPGDLRKVSRLSRTHARKAEAVLRFYDVTRGIRGSKNVPGFFDISVDLKAGNWYVHLWSAEKSYFVELGIRTASGRFLPIAASNTAEVPPARPSPHSDEDYLLVTGDYDIVKRVGGRTDMKALSSSPTLQKEAALQSIPLKAHHSGSGLLIRHAPSAMQAVHASLKRLQEVGPCEMAEINFIFGISSGSSVPEREGDSPVGC